VRTGGSMTGCLKPSHEPATLSGTEMTNQMMTTTSIVVKGTAPDAPRPQTNRFSRKNVAKTMPGSATGV
jgi:hypothetical protein